MRVRATVVFRGRVQGVNFRYHCSEQAASLGVDGYVRNMDDGSVEAVFEGERETVEVCIDWNRRSQPAARVTSADVTWSPPTGGFSGFEILR